MFIKNLTRRERYLTFATLSIALTALIYIFVLEPIAARWKSLNDEIESKINVLGRDAGILSRYKYLESEYAKLSKFVKSTKGEEEEVSAILAYIETVSRNNSCFIVNIKPVGTKNLGSYKEVLIDVTAEADVNQFSKFLYDIESSKNALLKVRRFTITSKSNQPNILRGTFIISKILID